MRGFSITYVCPIKIIEINNCSGRNTPIPLHLIIRTLTNKSK
jgi:hypothetical protein